MQYDEAQSFTSQLVGRAIRTWSDIDQQIHNQIHQLQGINGYRRMVQETKASIAGEQAKHIDRYEHFDPHRQWAIRSRYWLMLQISNAGADKKKIAILHDIYRGLRASCKKRDELAHRHIIVTGTPPFTSVLMIDYNRTLVASRTDLKSPRPEKPRLLTFAELENVIRDMERLRDLMQGLDPGSMFDEPIDMPAQPTK